MVQRDETFEFDAPRYADIAEEMANGPPEDHDDPWFHVVSLIFFAPLQTTALPLAHERDSTNRIMMPALDIGA
jgi:hypothetical protein